jgi:hypothetical protein
MGEKETVVHISQTGPFLVQQPLKADPNARGELAKKGQEKESRAYM